MALAGHWHMAAGQWSTIDDQTENLKKLPVCSVERWTEVLMKKVSEAAAVGDVVASQAVPVRTTQAENQRLRVLPRQQLSQMEARLTAQQPRPQSQVPATPRFHGVCGNCRVYGHQARECTATRRPEDSSKGSTNGGFWGDASLTIELQSSITWPPQ